LPKWIIHFIKEIKPTLGRKSPVTQSIQDKRGSPEMLADALMGKIFRGEFPPASRLPAERQLATQLGVDRTTLRMALKQLQRMNLLVVRHGSGVEVNDYRVEGGLDVLAAMFALDDVPLDGSLVLEALEFWQEGFSVTAAKAIARMSLDDFRGIEALLDKSIASVGKIDAFLEAQLAIQDELARLSGSIMFRMLSNSTRSLRRRIMRLLPETMDMTSSLDEMKRKLRLAVATRPGEAVIRDGVLDALRRQSAMLRERILLTPSAQGAGRPRPSKRRAKGSKDGGKKKGDSGPNGTLTKRAASHRGRARRHLR
jgi:GntR family transcriptional regulator, transcriptional repressor for pyruvate dehydrogenase complex